MLSLTVALVLSQAGFIPAQGPVRFQPIGTYHPRIAGRVGAAFDDGGWVVAWADQRRSPGTTFADVWVTTVTDAGIMRALASPQAIAERRNVQLVSTELQRVVAWTENVADGGVRTIGRSSTLSTAWPIQWGEPGELSVGGRPDTTVLAGGRGSLGLVWVEAARRIPIIDTGMPFELLGYADPVAPTITMKSPPDFLVAVLHGGKLVTHRFGLSSGGTLDTPLTPPFRLALSSQPPEVVHQGLSGGLSFFIEGPGTLTRLTTMVPTDPAIPVLATPFHDGTLLAFRRPDGSSGIQLISPQGLGNFQPLPSPVTMVPVLLTSNPARNKAVVVEQGAGGLTAREIALIGGAPEPDQAITLDLLAEPQQRPTIAWSAARSAFLLMWDEGPQVQVTRYAYLRLDGTLGMSGRVGGEVDGGSRPRLVEGPDLQVVRTESGSTTASLLTEGATPVLSAPVPTSSTLAFTRRGSRSVLGWSSTGELFLDWQLIPNFALPRPPPRCAAFRNGTFTLGDLSFGTRIDVREDGGVVASLLPIRGVGAACFAVSPSGALVVAYRSDAGIELYDLDARAALMPPQPGEGEPLVTALGSSMLISWIDPTGVNGVVVGSGVERVLIDTPRLDARELAVSSSPEGPAAVVWQSFDPSTGRLLINARLVTTAPRDGGAPSDAGSSTDAGNAEDAGVTFDGGVPDAGVANPEPEVTFVAVCGCDAASGLPLVVAALWLARRSRRGPPGGR